MSLSLIVSMLILAVVASPHCASMCGCGFAKRPMGQPKATQLSFQLGRSLVYVGLGAIAGAANGALAHAAISLAPAISALHWMVLAVVGFMGVVMIALPNVTLQTGQWVPMSFAVTNTKNLRPMQGFGFGLRWVAMPCGVIFAGLALAYLTASWWQGAVLMGVLAIGTTVSLQASQLTSSWIKNRWGERRVTQVQGVAVLFGLVVLVARQLEWLPTPAALQGLGFCL